MFDTKPHGVTHSIMFASGTSNPGKFMQQHLCMNYGSSILPFDQGYISCVNDSVMHLGRPALTALAIAPTRDYLPCHRGRCRVT